MRIRITLAFDEKMSVPVHHQEWLHGLIYHSIRDENYRDFLHNQGFQQGKRQFRMFTFSKLQGEYLWNEVASSLDYLPPRASFIFSAYDRRLVQELASTLLIKDDLRIGPHRVRVDSIEQIHEHLSERMLIRFITPVTMYSTFMLGQKRKTYYYSPYEEEFSPLIEANACKKYEALYGRKPEKGNLILSPAYKKAMRPRITKFKSTVIKGWLGEFVLEGDRELIELTHAVGLGGKNSNGHGLFKIISHL